jgi:hypothetical protein
MRMKQNFKCLTITVHNKGKYMNIKDPPKQLQNSFAAVCFKATLRSSERRRKEAQST